MADLHFLATGEELNKNERKKMIQRLAPELVLVDEKRSEIIPKRDELHEGGNVQEDKNVQGVKLISNQNDLNEDELKEAARVRVINYIQVGGKKGREFFKRIWDKSVWSYGLCVMGNEKMKPGEIYLQEQDGKIVYYFMLDKEKVSGTIDSIKPPEKFELKYLHALRPQIINYISKAQEDMTLELLESGFSKENRNQEESCFESDDFYKQDRKNL